MTRARRRSEDRLRAKGKLTPDEAAALEQQRKRREKPPAKTAADNLDDAEIAALEEQRRQWKESPAKEIREMVVQLLAAVRRSNVAPPLERKLRHHAGRTSGLPVEAMLVLVMLNWHLNSNYLRIDIHKAMLALDPQSAFDLGLCTRAEWWPISRHVVYKQYRRLDRALQAERKRPGKRHEFGWWDVILKRQCNAQWLMDELLAATIPRKIRRLIKSGAIDDTHFETYARTVNFAKQKVAKARGQKPSKDPHAELGYKTPTQKSPGERYCGFRLTTAIAEPEKNWHGTATRKPTIVHHPPPIVLAATLTPAGTNTGNNGFTTVCKAQLAAPNLSRLVADRGFSDKKNFVTGLLELGIRTTFDYKNARIARSDTVIVNGRGRTHTLMLHGGAFFPIWMPAELLVPAAREDEGDKPGPYSKRAERWRYSVHKIDYTARTIHLICPVHAGRLTYPGSPIVPNKDALEVDGPGPEKPCCHGNVAIEFDELAQFQDIPWGTIAWRDIYRSHRAIMEGLHGDLRD